MPLSVAGRRGQQQSANTVGSVSLSNLSDLERMAVSGDAVAGGGSDIEDIDELFGEIDWATANFSELEAKWRAELAAIERDNVTALLESSDRGQSVLPTVNLAIAEVARVEELVADYNRQLKLMGQEISQIAGINRVLDVQARNQEALLAELNRLFASLNVPDEALAVLARPDFAGAQTVPTLERAAKALYCVLNGRFERGMKDIRGVAERLAGFRRTAAAYEDGLLRHLAGLLKVPPAGRRRSDRLKPHRLDALNGALAPYAPLVQLLGQTVPDKYLDFRAIYESVCKSVLTTEMAEVVAGLQGTHLASKTPDEKPSFLLSSNRPSSGFDVARLFKGQDFSAHKAFGADALPELGAQDRLLPEQLLDYMLLLTVETAGQLFDTVEALFFPAADGAGGTAARAGPILDSIFANMQDLLVTQLADKMTGSDRLSAFAFVAVLERRLPEIGPEIPAMDVTLRAMLDRCTRVALEHTQAQVEAIRESRFSAKKRSGVFPSVAVFPKFVQVLERSIAGAPPGGRARALVNTAHESISAAIFASLAALVAEPGAAEDEKESLNACIMTVQNTYSLQDDLKLMDNAALEPILRRCKDEFARNVSSYAALSLPRILGKLPDFFEPIQRLLQSETPDEVSFHSAYSKAAAVRVLATLPAKEARKAVEAIRERVLKHFQAGSDGPALVPLVWAALGDYTRAKVQEYVEVVFKVYPASDVQLQFSAEDMAGFFRQVAS